MNNWSRKFFWSHIIIENATSERLWPHFYKENIGNKNDEYRFMATCLHHWKMRGYIRYILNNSVYGRTVGIYENPRGASSNMVDIICLPLVGIGLNDVTKMETDLAPSVPTALYGQTTIKFDWLLIANPFLMVSSLIGSFKRRITYF